MKNDCFLKHNRLFPKEEMAALVAAVRKNTESGMEQEQAKIAAVEAALVEAQADLQEVTVAIEAVIHPGARAAEIVVAQEQVKTAAAERQAEREHAERLAEIQAAESKAAREAIATKTSQERSDAAGKEMDAITATARKRMLNADPEVLAAKPKPEDWMTPEETAKVARLQGEVISKPAAKPEAEKPAEAQPAAPAAEQPKRAYNPDQFELIYDKLETRPGTTDVQRRLGIAALRGLFGGDRRAGATLLGSALWRDFQERAGSELIGQQAGSASDLALAAQILRDPRFETLRVFFVKAGKIVGHTGWTSRLPGSVSFSINTTARSKQVKAGETGVGYNLRRALLKHEMEKLGADGYYMLHNHPSGSANPSRADEELTVKLVKEMPGFLGHVVIDHNEYASISRFGSSSLIKSERLAAQKPVPEVAHDALGMHIEGPSGIVAVGKMLQIQNGYATLVATNAAGNVQAIAEVPEVMLTESKDPMARGRALVRIRKFMNQTGSAGGAFIVAENPAQYDWLIKKGALTDAVGTDGKTRSQEGVLQPRHVTEYGRGARMVLAARQMDWSFGDRRNQQLASPNDFVSSYRGYKIEKQTKTTMTGGKREYADVFAPDGTLATTLNAETPHALMARIQRFVDKQDGVEQPSSPYNIGKRIEEAKAAGYKATAKRIVERIDQSLNPLGTLPEQKKYLAQRGLAQGLIEKADEAAEEIRDAFPKASEADKQAIFDYLTTAGATSNGIKDATARTNAEKIKAQIGKIGDQLVEHGMLSEEARGAHKGAYLPRLYLKHLLSEQDWKALGSGKKPSDMGYLKKRRDIPEDVRKVLLGEVTDPGFLAAVAVAKPSRDMALLDWLTQISRNENWILPNSLVEFTSTVTGKTIRTTPFWLKEDAVRLRKQARYYTPENAAKAETEAKRMDEVADDALEGIQGEHREFKQIPNTARYGHLRGMFVRQEIYDDLMGINDFLPTDPGWFQNIFGYGGVGTKVTQIWKGMKVAMNPPAQIRNFVSNAILMQLGGVPLRLVPARIFQAINEISTDGPHYKVGKKYGIAVSTFATQEVYRMKTELLDLEMKTRGMGALGRLHRIAALIFNKSTDFYQLSETIFKTGMIIDGMKRQKMSEEEAVQYGQKWLFDYSLIQKSARYARSAPIGIPFLTFSLKVLPRLLETAVLHPQRFIPWVALFYGFPMLVANMLDVDDDDLDKLKKALPEWLQDKGHALILPYKDDEGRWQVVDLGYFMPWTAWTELGKNIAAGEAGKAVKTAGIFSGPITDIVVAIKTGKDPFTGRDIWNKGDPPGRQLVSLMNYVWNLAAPPFLTDHGLVSPMGLLDKAYGGKMVQALTGTTNKFGEPRSSAGQAALYLAGINVQAITPEYTRAQNLQRMAREMQDVKIQMVQKLYDRSLTPERRKEITSEYAGELVSRVEKLKKYARESEINPRLATH